MAIDTSRVKFLYDACERKIEQLREEIRVVEYNRDVLVLVLFDNGMSYSEIAEHLGIPKQRVEKVLKTVRKGPDEYRDRIMRTYTEAVQVRADNIRARHRKTS